MKRILMMSAALLATGLYLMPDDAFAQRGGRGGGGWGGGGGGFRSAGGGGFGGWRGGGGGGGGGRLFVGGGGWGRGGFRADRIDRGFGGGRVASIGRRWDGRGVRRPWRHYRYGYYGPWYGGYPYWGLGTGLVVGAALGAGYPYYGYGYGPAYYEPECVQVRRRVWTGRAWRVRVTTECY